MSSKMRLQITLSDSASAMDAAIIRHLSQFRSGSGTQERAFEVKRLIGVSILNEKHQQSAGYSGHLATSISLVKQADDIQGRADEHRTLEIAQEATAIPNGAATRSSDVIDPAQGDKNAMGMIDWLEKQTGIKI